MVLRRTRTHIIILAALLAAMAGCAILDPDPANRPPVIDAVTAAPQTVSPDSAAAVAVQASDPEGVDLDYRWRSSAGWFESGTYESEAVWRAPATTGFCTLTVTVDDGRDETSASLTMSVTPYANEPHLVATAVEQYFIEDRMPVRLTNWGNAQAVWEASSTVDWAAPEPAAGTLGPAEFDTIWFEADRTGLAAGPHTADLIVQTVGGETLSMRFGLVIPWAFEVVARYPHDPAAFTQGLVWHDGSLYESTGLYGHSSLRQVTLETGQVLRQVDLHPSDFGEGITIWQDRIIQLTWRNNTAYVWALADFSPLGTFAYDTQGWGLTHDGGRLVMSDGTSTLYFRDPDTFAETGRVTVTAYGRQLSFLNELEWIAGGVWANVWYSDSVVRIDPESGEVTDLVDLSGLLTPEEDLAADVLNGIAHDPATGRTWVTGKRWPWLFEIELVDPSSDGQRFFFAR